MPLIWRKAFAGCRSPAALCHPKDLRLLQDAAFGAKCPIAGVKAVLRLWLNWGFWVEPEI